MNHRDVTLCIISGADRVRYRSHVNQAVYAGLNGADYRFDFGIAAGGLRSHFDIKIRALQRILPRYEWVLWVDDDVWFTDFRRSTLDSLVAEAEARGASIVIAKGAREPRGFSSYLNSGVLLLRNSPASLGLLDGVLSTPIAEVETWWDEERFGIFTRGDQDQIVKTIVDRDLRASTWLTEPHRLNSRSHLYRESAEEALACHFCGHYDRELSVAQFAERFDLSPDLVPVDVAKEYGLPMLEMSRWERKAREQRREWRGRVKPYLKPVRDAMRRRRRAC